MQTELIKQEMQTAAKAGQVLFENHKFLVIHAQAAQLQNTLPAIGKLRELNFRMVGEGTGNDIDLDEFDQHYTHIVVWNKKAEGISSAVRLGELAKLAQQYGIHGIYTRLEFEFDENLVDELSTTVELSRLFVNLTGTKNYFGLYLIFYGVSSWMARNKYYTHILGSVSISKEIPEEIHGLIIAFCRKNYFDNELSKLIRPFKPAEFAVPSDILAKLDEENPLTFEALDKFIETHYRLKNQVPILFKKYHAFSANYLAFGIDDNFSSVTDPLMLVNFLDSPKETLSKFMDKDLLADYLAHFKKV